MRCGWIHGPGAPTLIGFKSGERHSNGRAHWGSGPQKSDGTLCRLGLNCLETVWTCLKHVWLISFFGAVANGHLDVYLSCIHVPLCYFVLFWRISSVRSLCETNCRSHPSPPQTMMAHNCSKQWDGFVYKSERTQPSIAIRSCCGKWDPKIHKDMPCTKQKHLTTVSESFHPSGEKKQSHSVRLLSPRSRTPTSSIQFFDANLCKVSSSLKGKLYWNRHDQEQGHNYWYTPRYVVAIASTETKTTPNYPKIQYCISGEYWIATQWHCHTWYIYSWVVMLNL